MQKQIIGLDGLTDCQLSPAGRATESGVHRSQFQLHPRATPRPVASPLALPAMAVAGFRRPVILALLAAVSLALALRLANLPGPTEVRDFDETLYLSSGLVMFEGMPPGYKASPAASEIWFSWLSAAFETVRSLASAKAALGADASIKTVPFVAVDYALAKLYSDMSGLARAYLIWSALLASAAAGFACWLGIVKGGKDNAIPMGLMLGGLVACLPGLIELGGSPRSYSDGWCLAFIAIAIAGSWNGAARVAGTGVALGLALACRIDMLLVFPIVLWEFLVRPEGEKQSLAPAMKAAALAVVTCLLAAPWLLTGLFGVFRLIATVRVAGAQVVAGDQSLMSRFEDIFIAQGTLPLVLLAVLALILMIKRLGWRDWLLVAYAGLLLVTPFLGYRMHFRHHGAPIVAMVSVGALLVIGWARTLPNKAAWLVAVAVLSMPLVQTVREIGTLQEERVDDSATAWVEAHVPAGTRVYLDAAWELRPPLPARDAALAIWQEISAREAAERKFEHGLSYYSAKLGDVPFAMSEENMMLDRSNFRRWLILGGGPATDRPRYDVRIVRLGPTFGVQDPRKALREEPGIYVSRAGLEIGEFGAPVAEWRSASGNRAVRIYASPEVRPRLKGVEHSG